MARNLMPDTYTTANSGAGLAHTYDRRTIGKVEKRKEPDPLKLKREGQAGAFQAMERS
jgi:hypothetical protein